MESIWTRMMRAARLENALYDEVEADTKLTGEAITVVIIVAICAGIGALISALVAGAGAVAVVGGLIGGIVMALVGYFVWAVVSMFVGNALGGKADYGEMLRCLGYAQTPQALSLLSFIPFLGGLLAFIGAVWALVAGIVGLRQALDFTTGKAIITAIVGWVALLIIYMIIGAILAGMGLAGAALLGGLSGGM